MKLTYQQFLELYGIEEDFQLKNLGIVYGKRTSVSDKIFEHEIEIESQDSEKYLRVIISNCTFKNSFKLQNFKSKGLPLFEKCQFENNFTLENIKCDGSLKIIDSSFKLNASLVNFDSSNVKIENCKFDNGLQMNQLIIKGEVSLNSCNIKNTLLINGINDDAVLKIRSIKEGCLITCVSLKDVKNAVIGYLELPTKISQIRIDAKRKSHSNYELTNLNVQDLSFREIENESTLKLNSVNSSERGGNILEICDSNLNYSSFKDCDFSSYFLNFENSKIESLTISGTYFPEPTRINKDKKHLKQHTFDALQLFKKKLEAKGDVLNSTKYFETELLLKLETSNTDDYKEKKDLYSQLKKMYEQRGDSVKSLEYQAKELEIHMKSTDISWSERLNLKFAYWSNNFGTDWVKAIRFLFWGSIVFYLIFIFFQDYRFGNDWNLLGNIVANYFEFLNPLRKPDFFTVNGNIENLNISTRILDFFARIFIAFAEYQLIQAFRKYGKK